MYLIYIHCNNNINDLILNLDSFLKKSTPNFKIIIISDSITEINHELITIQNKIIYDNIQNLDHDFIIEINDTIDLNFVLTYDYKSCEYINSNYPFLKQNNYDNILVGLKELGIIKY